MDTSNLPHEHLCYVAERKNIPRLFSDDTDGKIMTEICALKAESYAYMIDGKEVILVNQIGI